MSYYTIKLARLTNRIVAEHPDPQRRVFTISSSWARDYTRWKVCSVSAATEAQRRSIREMGLPAGRRVARNVNSGYIAVGTATGYVTLSPPGDMGYNTEDSL